MSENSPLSRQVVVSLCVYAALGGGVMLVRHLHHSEPAAMGSASHTSHIAVSNVGMKTQMRTGQESFGAPGSTVRHGEHPQADPLSQPTTGPIR